MDEPGKGAEPDPAADDPDRRSGIWLPGAATQSMIESIGYHVRTPMNAILGSLDVLVGEGVNAHQRRLAQTAYASAEALMRLLTDVLDLARIEADLLQLVHRPFLVQRVLDQAVSSRRSAAAIGATSISWEMLDTVPTMLLGDEARLLQALGGLIDCALGVLHGGFVKLEADFEPSAPRAAVGDEPAPGQLRLSLSFAGEGVQTDWPERLLEPFALTAVSQHVGQGGSGLGMVVARRLIELMGGALIASRTIDGSLMLGIDLPMAPATAESGAREPFLEDAAAIARGMHAKVLVVDDNAVGNYLTRLMLEQFGFQVVTVSSGEEAVEQAADEAFDLILMDCVMPGMDGCAATRAIRAAERRIRRPNRIPIIALTAQSDAEEERACLEAGMTGFLSKPVRLQALREALANQLRATASPHPED